MKLSSRNLIILILPVLAATAVSCAGEKPSPTPVVVTVPVVETRIVQVTREVERTVVVTVTPAPTPTYASPINAPAGTLTYPLPGDMLTLDPQEAYDLNSLLVLQQLYEGPFNLRGDGTLAPAAATDYIVSADGTAYTLTLRSGLTWSDGQPLTAQHYVDGVCRLLDPMTGNPFYYLLAEVAPIRGAAAYAGGDLADCGRVGVTAVDDLTLRIALERPVAFFPQLLATHLFWPARPDALHGTADAFPPSTSQSVIHNPQSAIVNGPYLLAEYRLAEQVVLVRNPAYWNTAEVEIKRIELPIVPDPVRQLALYEAGDLMVAAFPARETARIQADPAFARELHVLAQPGTSYLAFNVQALPTDNLNVRRAIASAVDRRSLITDVLGQPWRMAASRLVPAGVPGYDDGAEVYPFDLSAARAYLAEAGYGPDNPLPPVELWYNRGGNNDAIFQAIAAMLEAAGIPVRLVSSRWEQYLAALENCNKPLEAGAARSPGECSYHLYGMGWMMDYADPASMLQVLSPQSRFQYTGWSSNDYEQLLAKAAAELDAARRSELYRQAEDLLLRQAVVFIPLQHYDRLLLVKRGITFEFPLFGPPHFQYWRLR